MNPHPGSISQWLHRLKAGDRSATEAIWSRFYPKLVRLANTKLSKNPDPAIGGEDIAQSSFRNVCQGVLDGRYPQLDNREDFWKLLFVSTANRICSHFRSCGSMKRNGVIRDSLDSIDEELLKQLNSQEAQTELADLIEHLLRKLDSEDLSGELRQIALLFLDEHSASWIAKTLHRRKTNILQKIRWIRAIWEETLIQETLIHE